MVAETRDRNRNKTTDIIDNEIFRPGLKIIMINVCNRVDNKAFYFV